MSPGDIDLLQLYDGYSYLLLNQLEDFGFCGPGGVAELIHGGRLGRTGGLRPDVGQAAATATGCAAAVAGRGIHSISNSASR